MCLGDILWKSCWFNKICTIWKRNIYNIAIRKIWSNQKKENNIIGFGIDQLEIQKWSLKPTDNESGWKWAKSIFIFLRFTKMFSSKKVCDLWKKSLENALKVSLTRERETAEAYCVKLIFSLSASDLHTFIINAQPRHVVAVWSERWHFYQKRNTNHNLRNTTCNCQQGLNPNNFS